MNDQFPAYITLAPKDPLEALDYTEDWSKELDGATIRSVEWIVPGGLNKAAEEHDDTTATIRLTGGTRGNDYFLRCKVTDSDGELLVRSIKLPVRDR